MDMKIGKLTCFIIEFEFKLLKKNPIFNLLDLNEFNLIQFNHIQFNQNFNENINPPLEYCVELNLIQIQLSCIQFKLHYATSFNIFIQMKLNC